MSTKPRNHVIDAARAAAIVVVVVFHGLLYKVGFVDGRPAMTPWAAPTFLYPLTWVFMIIPIFFVAGGFAHALMADRARAEGSSYRQYLANRGRRLVGPVLVFVTFCAAVSTVAAWSGHLVAAADLSRQLMQLLWFITVYLVIVAVAPAMVRLHDRFGWRPMAVLALAAAAVDAWSFAAGEYQLRNLNMLAVWPLVHQFGIAYERGWFRRGPAWTPWAAVAGGALGIWILVTRFGYPPTSVGFADLPIANVQPPTLAMALLALAQCGVLGLVERSGRLDRVGPRVGGVVRTLNALMMSIYLWHIGCIALAAAGLLLLASLVPPLAGFLLSQLTVAACSLVVVALLVPWIARLEYRMIPPLGSHQLLTGAVLAYGVLVLGTALVWLNGTVLHPARPWSTAGVSATWLGAWLMRRAANATRPRSATGQ